MAWLALRHKQVGVTFVPSTGCTFCSFLLTEESDGLCQVWGVSVCLVPIEKPSPQHDRLDKWLSDWASTARSDFEKCTSMNTYFYSEGSRNHTGHVRVTDDLRFTGKLIFPDFKHTCHWLPSLMLKNGTCLCDKEDAERTIISGNTSQNSCDFYFMSCFASSLPFQFIRSRAVCVNIGAAAV